MDKGKLLADYNYVFDNMMRIANPEYQRPNLAIVKPDYIWPTISSERKPLEDPNGEFQYFKNIKEILEEALLYGKVSRLPHKAPEHLSELLVSNQL